MRGRGAIAAALTLVAFALSPVLSTLPGTVWAQEKKPRPRKPAARPKARSVKKPVVPAATPLASPTPPASAQPGLSESDAAKLARIRARRAAVEGEIRKLEGQTESTLKELDSIDLGLRLAAHHFDEAELEFKETRRLLDRTIADVQATKNKIAATKPRVLQSLAALSKLGELSYARLLFSLDDPSDILRGYRYVSRIASSDGEQIRAFRADLANLSTLEAQLKKRTAENLETRKRLNDARGALTSRKAQKESKLEQIARERQMQEELADEYERREVDIIRLLGESGNVGVAASGEAPPSPNLAPFEATTPLKARKGELPWPATGTLVKKFGVERDPRFGTRTIQQGIEIDAFPEVEVRAVHAGRVAFADHFVGYGMLVIVDHGGREHTLYGRLGELRVTAGQDVAEGALLGLLPNTRVTGSGLHFEVRIQGRPEDPQDWLASRPK